MNPQNQYHTPMHNHHRSEQQPQAPSQLSSHPHFLMQFNKDEKVPKLISINQSHENNQLSPQKPQIYNKHRQIVRTQISQKNYQLEVIKLQKQLSIERTQKSQLQQIIKELTLKSQRLKEINQHLINRLKEVQKNYIQNRSELEKENKEQLYKQKQQIYSDVQGYLRDNIERLSLSLKGEKMNEKTEIKLEEFMEEMLHINSHSVEMLKISKIKQQKQQRANSNVHSSNPNKNISLLLDSSLQRQNLSPQKQQILSNLSMSREHSHHKGYDHGPNPKQYNTLLSHLNQPLKRHNLTHEMLESSSAGKYKRVDHNHTAENILRERQSLLYSSSANNHNNSIGQQEQSRRNSHLFSQSHHIHHHNNNSISMRTPRVNHHNDHSGRRNRSGFDQGFETNSRSTDQKSMFKTEYVVGTPHKRKRIFQ